MADALADLPWREVEELIHAYGGEQHLASRVKQWREERGWSLEELGRKFNPPLNRSTVYKIENPSESRKIQVDEVLRFAKVFDKSFAEVLLPDMTIAELEGWKVLRQAADTLNEIRWLSGQYADAIESVRRMIQKNPALGERVAQSLRMWEERQVAQAADPWINDARDGKESKLRQSLVEQSQGRLPSQAIADGYGVNTPASQAASDALSEVPLTHRLWTKTLEPVMPTHPNRLHPSA